MPAPLWARACGLTSVSSAFESARLTAQKRRNFKLVLFDGSLLRGLPAMRIKRALRGTRSLGGRRALAIFLMHRGRTLRRTRGEILLRRLMLGLVRTLRGTRRGRLFLLVGADQAIEQRAAARILRGRSGLRANQILSGT